MKKIDKQDVEELQQKLSDVQKFFEAMAKLEATIQEMEDGQNKDILKLIFEKIKKDQVDPIIESLNKVIESSQRVIETRENLIESFPSGSFIGDMMRVETHKDLEAAKRLVTDWFPKQAIFHTNKTGNNKSRWDSLESIFNERRQEQGKDWETAWQEMATSALFLVLTQPRLENTTLRSPFHHRSREYQKSNLSLWHWLRNEIRKEIERDLLEGITTDAKVGREKKYGKIEQLPEEDSFDDDSPEAIELQRKLAKEISLITQDKSEEDILSLPIDLRIDAIQAMNKLTENEKLAIMGEIEGYSDEEIAAEKGVSVNVVQQWRARGRSKMRELTK